MDASEERQWVERAAHDPEAFSRLYRQYCPRLYAYAGYRTPTPQDAEDVVAETFLRVVQALGSFRWRHEQSFAAWVFRIARNVLSDQRRQGRRGPVLPLDVLAEVADRTPLPEDVLVRQEEIARVRTLLGTLAPRHQEVITLKFFAQLRNAEIARVLEIEERTVAAHLCRGLDHLERRYRDQTVGMERGVADARQCHSTTVGRRR